MLLYNITVVGVFVYTCMGLGLTGNGLWTAAMLHTVYSDLCALDHARELD